MLVSQGEGPIGRGVDSVTMPELPFIGWLTWLLVVVYVLVAFEVVWLKIATRTKRSSR